MNGPRLFALHLVTALLVFAGLSGSASAQELGRLFLTPEQREILDTRRRARLPDKPAEVVVQSSFARLDGFVRRSAGPSTTFVNGEAVTGSAVEGLRMRPDSDDPARVAISTGEDGRPVDLKVGQTVERISGEVTDMLGGGEVKANHRGERKP